MAKATKAAVLIGLGVYPLRQHYEAAGSTLDANLDEAFGWVAGAGLMCVETFAESPGQIKSHGEAMRKAGLTGPSVYVNSRLHEDDWKVKADAVVELAKVAKAELPGCVAVTTNPEPIRWGSSEDKSDEQLRTQAGALRYLHDTLARLGIGLYYHTHDPEMRQGAREFHHCMLSTADKPMRWCLDTHWIYRGCGNSNVAVEDAVKLYGRRIAAMHLRQSKGGVWTETFGDGDVDARSWLSIAKLGGFTGPIYLEQAVEAGTPTTLPMPERLKASAAELKRLLGMQ